MDYLAAMRAFVRAVDLGSFSQVAAEEQIKVSTVSRYVSALEADLGAALFNRSTRRLHLTEVGTAFYERCVAILTEIEDARLAVSSLNAKPQGLLKINIPAAFGRRHVVPHLRDFRELYPLIRVDVTLTDATVNLIETGSDLAIRIRALADSELVARRLAPQRRLLVGSRECLQKYGTPNKPGDLSEHPCLLFALQPRDAWYFRPSSEIDSDQTEVKIKGDFRTNDSEALLQAVRDGLGLALLPTWLLAEDMRTGGLVPLLPAYEWAIAPGPERAIWGIYPPKKTVSPKVRAFLDFIAEKFGRPAYWDRDLSSLGRETATARPARSCL